MILQKYVSSKDCIVFTYQISPKGQSCGKAYPVAVNGTQNTMKRMSATARFRISRLVVFRICLLKLTTRTTRRFPKSPTKTTIAKNRGATIPNTFSIWYLRFRSGFSSSAVVMFPHESRVKFMSEVVVVAVVGSREVSVTEKEEELDIA